MQTVIPYTYPARAKNDEFTKVTIYLVTEAQDTNPNGDPVLGGMPRTQNDYGIISDVCLKRKLNNMLEQKSPAAMKAMEDLKLDPKEHRVTFGDYSDTQATDEVSKMQAVINKVVANKTAGIMDFWNYRTFGFLGIADKKKAKKAKKEKAKKETSECDETESDAEEQLRDKANGVIQFKIGRSINKVSIFSHQITRSVGTGATTASGEDKASAMGSRHVVEYGIYGNKIAMNSAITQLKNNFTKKSDIELLRRLLKDMYSDSSSSARQLNLLHLYWYEHSTAHGDIPDWVLHDIWTPKIKSGMSGNSRDEFDFYDPENPTEYAKKMLKDNVSHIRDFAISLD